MDYSSYKKLIDGLVANFKAKFSAQEGFLCTFGHETENAEVYQN